jgi:hypothetical protein
MKASNRMYVTYPRAEAGGITPHWGIRGAKLYQFYIVFAQAWNEFIEYTWDGDWCITKGVVLHRGN